MKILNPRLAFLTVILTLGSVCRAQGVPAPVIGKGSVIVYDVKENKVSYQYTVTVTKFSEADGIELKWTTNEKPAKSGTTAMAFTNLDNATKLKIKPVPGNEKLGEDQLRVLFSNDVVTTLVGKKFATIEIDGKEDMFLYLSAKAETETFNYNGEKVSVDFSYGDAGATQIGFVTIGDYQVVHTFRSKEFTFTLKSVTTK